MLGLGRRDRRTVQRVVGQDRRFILDRSLSFQSCYLPRCEGTTDVVYWESRGISSAVIAIHGGFTLRSLPFPCADCRPYCRVCDPICVPTSDISGQQLDSIECVLI